MRSPTAVAVARATDLPVAPRLNPTTALVLGTGVSALAFDLVLRAHLGLGPWHVLTTGAADKAGIEIGPAIVVLQVSFLATAIALRERPGVGTIVAALGLGVLIDATLPFIPEPDLLHWRFLFFTVGTVTMALGGALFVAAAKGAAPIDAVMTGMYRRLPLSLYGVRLCLEAIGLAAGIALGGEIGVGTVIIGLGIGPLLELWLRWLGAMPTKAVTV